METQAAPFLVTKLQPPPVRPDHIVRPRLRAQLTDGIRSGRALTLVAAPAGYGKTTLVTGWLARMGLPSAWLALDDLDNDPVRFLTGLVAAIGTVDPEIAANVAPLLQGAQQPAPTAVVATLVNQLALRDDPLLLVLDDYHAITDRGIHVLLDFLLDHRPASLHLVVLTRADPPLALSRLRVRGQLTELRAADLRFTTEEAATFLRDVMHLPLDEAALGTLERRTEGWIAGLQLAALALAGPRISSPTGTGQIDADAQAAFLEDFGGSHRYVIDYLLDEVLRHQPEDVRAFLMATAVLDRMTASLCDAMLDQDALSVPGETPPRLGRTNTGSQAMLAHLDAANLFIIALDGHRTWYRYHHLFAEVLRSSLPVARARVLHQRAAQWFAEYRMWPEAIHHALEAGRPTDAAGWIADAADAHLRAGQLHLLLRWINSLPHAVANADPQVATIRAVALLLTGDLPALTRHIEALDGGDALSDPAMRGRIRALQAWIANARGSEEIQRYAEEALDLLDPDDTLFRILGLIPMSNVYAAGDDLEAANAALTEAVALAEAADQPLAALGALANLAFNLLESGQRHRAQRLCEAARAKYVDAAGRPLPVSCIIALPMATIHYLSNELDLAETYAQEGLQGSRELFSNAIMGGDAERVLARIYAARGEVDRGLALLSDAASSARGQGVLHVARLLEAAMAAQQLRSGEVAAAEAWAKEAGIGAQTAPLSYEDVPYQAWPTLLDLLIHQGRWPSAEALIRERERRLAAAGRDGRLIYTRLQHANLAAAQGDLESALAHLQRCLPLAARERYLRPFIDIATPEVQALYRHLHPDAPAFVEALLTALGEDNGPARAPTAGPSPALASATGPVISREAANGALVEPLTDREFEVLDLIAEGFTNQQIAETLYVSVGTVKRHAYNLYGKLDVSSRTQAVARAQELGLLA